MSLRAKLKSLSSKRGNLLLIRDCFVMSGTSFGLPPTLKLRWARRNDVCGFLSVMLLLPMIAQASLLSSQLGYRHYQSWRHADQLYYSTFNNGEQWKSWPSSRYELEPLNLVDQINVCYAHGGGWNHYFNDCVIDDEDQLLSYIEAVEDAERFGFHFSAPALVPEAEEDFTQLSVEEVDWEHYASWSPEKQLYFSTLGEGEKDGAVIEWEFSK